MNEESLKNPSQPLNPPIPQDPTDNRASADGGMQRPHVTETPQKAIRTYESDVADVLSHKNISTATIALAENKKQTGENRLGNIEELNEAQTHDSHIVKKLLIGLASLILIAGGGGGAYYLYTLSPLAEVRTAPQNQQSPAAASIVPADKQVGIVIDNMAPYQIVRAVRNEAAKTEAPGSIKEIVLVQNKNGQKSPVTGPEMADIMDIKAPDILLRALAQNWMLGVYTDPAGGKDIFVIATNDYFQNAFAGMLQWESVMADDLKLYLYGERIDGIANAPETVPETTPTTGSTTISNESASSTNASSTDRATSEIYVKNYSVLRGSFVDRIIRNKDVREFITDDGPLFLYSFINNNKLIITGSESTLNAVFDRLEQKAFVR